MNYLTLPYFFIKIYDHIKPILCNINGSRNKDIIISNSKKIIVGPGRYCQYLLDFGS